MLKDVVPLLTLALLISGLRATQQSCKTAVGTKSVEVLFAALDVPEDRQQQTSGIPKMRNLTYGP